MFTVCAHGCRNSGRDLEPIDTSIKIANRPLEWLDHVVRIDEEKILGKCILKPNNKMFDSAEHTFKYVPIQHTAKCKYSGGICQPCLIVYQGCWLCDGDWFRCQFGSDFPTQSRQIQHITRPRVHKPHNNQFYYYQEKINNTRLAWHNTYLPTIPFFPLL